MKCLRMLCADFFFVVFLVLYFLFLFLLLPLFFTQAVGSFVVLGGMGSRQVFVGENGTLYGKRPSASGSTGSLFSVELAPHAVTNLPDTSSSSTTTKRLRLVLRSKETNMYVRVISKAQDEGAADETPSDEAAARALTRGIDHWFVP